MVIRSFKCYRAVVSNGVILENACSFKNVFRGAVRELKGSYGHSLYFTNGYAELSFGVLTEVWEGSRCRSSWIELRKIARIDCFSIDRTTYVTTRKEK